jgi:hypothetical protein
MKAFWEEVKLWIRHNQSMTISFVLFIVFSLWFFGCQSRTTSLLNPVNQVCEGELNIEYQSELARLENEMTVLKSTTEIRLQDLHRQDAFKQSLYNNARLVVDGNNPNPIGLLSLIGTIFGIGAVIDNRKKDGIIKGLQILVPKVQDNANPQSPSA